MSLGNNLLFLISQPRAGSTLLQRMLATHPDIYTVSEPWLMLYPLFFFKEDHGVHADYDVGLGRKATKQFLADVFSGGLYTKALENSGKRFFLDKTPRYYFILAELLRTFPQAHFLLLMRNPLAVLCSIVDTFVRGKWHRLAKYRCDLINAPRLLLTGIETLGRQGRVVSYEKLLKHPENEVKGICDWFGIDFEPSMIHYGRAEVVRWPFGDQKNVYRHTSPNADRELNWLSSLNDPQIWQLANDYLKFLGKETLEQMGYVYEDLRAMLDARRPSRRQLWFASSMERLLGVQYSSLD
jgi:hypothetical protein